jgi:hypothetical protein
VPASRRAVLVFLKPLFEAARRVTPASCMKTAGSGHWPAAPQSATDRDPGQSPA